MASGAAKATPLSNRLTGEFIGTFIFVFSIGCNAISGSPTWSPVSTSATLTVVVYAFARVSGAHLNPAVSLSLGLAQKLPWMDVGPYVAAQIGGALAASCLYTVTFEQSLDLVPGDGSAWWQAAGVELLFTFLLALVVLNVAASEAHARSEFFGVAIGAALLAGVASCRAISGAALNPALALALKVTSGGLARAHGAPLLLLYIAAELSGGALAAAAFAALRPLEAQRSAALPGGLVVRPRARAAPSLAVRLLAEFLGTYFFTLTMVLCVVTASVLTAPAAGAALTALVFALASCSGAHFNPATTLAAALLQRGIQGFWMPAKYVGVQLLAGCCGALTAAALAPARSPGFRVAHKGSGGVAGACYLELVFTMLVCFAMLSLSVFRTKTGSECFGLVAGGAATAAVAATAGVTGSALNPAVALGSGLVSLALGRPGTWLSLWYALAELAGGAAAALLYFRLHPTEFEGLAGKVRRSRPSFPPPPPIDASDSDGSTERLLRGDSAALSARSL